MSEAGAAPSSAPAGFVDDAAALGVTLDDAQVALLERFVTLLLDENRRTNLTAVREPGAAFEKHLLDSLSLSPLLPAEGSVVDVGAGGGLPGLPLAIARPDLHFTLVDATGKKVRHIERCIEALGLPHVRALQGRAEDLCGTHGRVAPPERERHDVAVCRALAPMPVLVELVSPFVRVGGRMLAIKGQRADTEIGDARSALERLQLRVSEQRKTPTGVVVCIDKMGSTPAKYPRRAGEPKRVPIR